MQEVEQRLQQKQQEIEAHIQVLEQELRSVGERVRTRALELWQRYGIWITAGALLAGIWTGRRLRRRGRRPSTGFSLEGLEGYLEKLAQEAAAAIEQGMEPEEALQKALAEHPPIVVNVLAQPATSPPSLWREALYVTLRTWLSEWLTTELSRALHRLKSED